MTLLINLFGGPGIGKSTAAAKVFASLKDNGVNVEMAREYVKGWAWEGRSVKPLDQLYFFGKQCHAETILLGKADVVVTDSPVVLAAMYLEKRGLEYKSIAQSLYLTCQQYYMEIKRDGHVVMNFMLQRSKPYNASGRYETLAQAKQMDEWIETSLNDTGMHYRTVADVDTIVASALRML
jgi:tRNA uridine 5-carbamoylmethylation protein Kti12